MNLPRMIDDLIRNYGLGDVVVSDGAGDWTLSKLVAALEESHSVDVLLPDYRGSIEWDHEWVAQFGLTRGDRPGRLSLSPIMKGYVARAWYVERDDEGGEDS